MADFWAWAMGQDRDTFGEIYDIISTSTKSYLALSIPNEQKVIIMRWNVDDTLTFPKV